MGFRFEQADERIIWRIWFISNEINLIDCLVREQANVPKVSDKDSGIW
jgi:hypothetical protein